MSGERVAEMPGEMFREVFWEMFDEMFVTGDGAFGASGEQLELVVASAIRVLSSGKVTEMAV
jgi:hypothetical protein